MSTADPLLPDERDALLGAARRVLAEDGMEAAIVLHPQLARSLAEALARDMGTAIHDRIDGVESIGEFVDALLDTVLHAAEAWRDALPLINMTLEQLRLFEELSAVLEPWSDALRDALEHAQELGVVNRDLDVGTTAFVLRDVLDRTAKACVVFGQRSYREASAALVRAALRA
jgi:DNA-binding transcriptional regulator YbjK